MGRFSDIRFFNQENGYNIETVQSVGDQARYNFAQAHQNGGADLAAIIPVPFVSFTADVGHL